MNGQVELDEYLQVDLILKKIIIQIIISIKSISLNILDSFDEKSFLECNFRGLLFRGEPF